MVVTTVRIERPEGTVAQVGIPAQIEVVKPQPGEDLGGNRDYYLYDVYLEWSPLWQVRRRDVLVDERNLDALTGQFARYRVTMAEQFDAHWEARCQGMVGS